MPWRRTGDPQIDDVLADPAIRFFIDREIRYGQTRALEFFLGVVMLMVGLILLYPERTFFAPDGTPVLAWRVIAHFVTETQAGWTALIVGGIRLAAIYPNGKIRYSPIPRTLGCWTGAAFWLGLSIGFAMAVPPLSLAVAVFPVFVLAEIYSARRAAADLIVLDTFGFRARERRRGSASPG